MHVALFQRLRLGELRPRLRDLDSPDLLLLRPGAFAPVVDHLVAKFQNFPDLALRAHLLCDVDGDVLASHGDDSGRIGKFHQQRNSLLGRVVAGIAKGLFRDIGGRRRAFRARGG